MSDPISVAALGLGAAGFLSAGVLHLRLRSLRKACLLLQGDAKGGSFMVAMARKTSELERLRAEVGRLHQEFDAFRGAVDESIRRVAVLRYDAYGEMGGRLSWSIALLDDHGDGVVLTALVGRPGTSNGTRCYVKSMRAGEADSRLSPEEVQVTEAALRPSGRGRVPSPARREPTPAAS